jgi:IclR family transcriptional regulator, KDG regulon repressor
MKTVKSIIKALNILDLFLSGKKELALKDIAELSGLDKATTNRIALTLVQQGYLEQRKKRGKYSLGIKSLDLNSTANSESGNGSESLRYLTEFSQLTGENAILMMWCGSDVLRSRAYDFYTGSIKLLTDDWFKLPLHSSSIGKIILASMSDEEVKNYFIKNNPDKFTPNTIVNINQMKEHLSIIRRESIAYEIEEHNPGVNGVASEVRNKDGEIVGAVFVGGPSNRLNLDKIMKISPKVKNCALKISQDLGYRV